MRRLNQFCTVHRKDRTKLFNVSPSRLSLSLWPANQSNLSNEFKPTDRPPLSLIMRRIINHLHKSIEAFFRGSVKNTIPISDIKAIFEISRLLYSESCYEFSSMAPPLPTVLLSAWCLVPFDDPALSPLIRQHRSVVELRSGFFKVLHMIAFPWKEKNKWTSISLNFLEQKWFNC